MDRLPFVCGNWKMNHDLSRTREVIGELVASLASDRIGPDVVEVGIAPVTTTLFAAAEAAKGSHLRLAGQNVHPAEKGAFTGEQSVAHLKEVGCTHVIVGHSERRQLFGETDAEVGQKVRATFDGGLIPIACVGETLDEREAGQTLDIIGRQIGAVLEGVEKTEAPQLVIAYEPVWAIGTGKTATAGQAQEVHAAIRKQCAAHFGQAEADALRIQYGGSVKPDNAAELLSEQDVDGALVGGASLAADSFMAIIKAAAGL